MNKTKKQYEEYLNNIGFNFEQLVYLTNKERGNYCSRNKLHDAIYNNKCGTLLRKLDSIAFNVGYNEWKY